MKVRGYSRENAYKEAKILWDVMDEMQEIWDRAMVQAQSSRLDGRQQNENGTESGTTEGNSGTKSSIRETDDGRFAAVVDNDILSEIDTSNWNKEKKKQAKKAAAEALKKFSNGIVVEGITRAVNKKSRHEYTGSKYTEELYRKDKEKFADKMRTASIADDVLVASTDWNRDGRLKHPRTDNFVDFDHGTTLIQSGENKYSAEVVVGITDEGEAVFYDVVDLTPENFKIKNADTLSAVTTQKVPDGVLKVSASETKVPQTGADVKSKAKFSLREKKTPTYEELVSKTPVRIVDVRSGIESGTYAEMKGEVLEKAIEKKWFDEPHLNEDTNSLIFLTPKSFSHAFTNLTADFGEDTIRSMAHIPEIIKDAVLVSVNEPKNSRKAESGVYTFFGAINGANGIEPVKLTVKEYDFKSLDGMPQNIRNYFNRSGIMEQYDTLYDTQALEVIGIESIKEEPDASVKVGEQSPRAQDTSDSSEIKVADLLELVKGDAEKYIPERGGQLRYSSREMRDTAEEAKGREESAAALRRENRILRERIEYWKKQSRVTKEYTLRNTDTLEYARELVKRLDSAATSAEVNQGLQEMGAYLLNAENVDWDMLWEHALTLAHSMTDDVDTVISDEMKAEREDFESFLKGIPVDVAPLVKAGEISYSDLKGYPIVHRKNGTTVDDLYQQLQERFGEGIFPDVPDGGDMIDNIKRYADAVQALPKKLDLLTSRKNRRNFSLRFFFVYAVLSDELDDGSLGCISAANADAGDAGVAAVALRVLGSDLIEHLLGDILAGDESKSLTVGSQILCFAKSYHFLGHGRDLFCAADGGFHSTLVQQIGNLLTEHCHALIGGLAEFSCSGHNCISSF